MQSLILQIVSATGVTAVACLAGVIIGHSKTGRKASSQYPSPEQTAPQGHILEEENALSTLAGRSPRDLQSRFKSHMAERKPFLNENVSIESVAASLGTNKTTLSKMVNDNFKMNWRQLLNCYRIKEAVTLLAKNPEMGMEQLRKNSGFNSVSTFTSSFSRFTGCTPGEYCKKNIRK